ncbi:hypothetical protein [Sorangium sp. So ce1182]|uniref:hypothetical protein n=1 Tax=Sorangium sp. So ce1182 TaxID=3133334 RepID=UPI003F63830E
MMSVDISILKLGVKPLGQWLAQLSQRNTEDFVRARDEMFREWIAELHRALHELVPEWEQRFNGLEAKINKLGEDPQLFRLLDNFGYEASREAINERRRLLAHAAAGAMNPDLTIAQKARVERVLRELDPDDVILLHKINAMSDASARYEALVASEASGDSLSGSGCIRTYSPEAYDAVTVAHVTTLGSWVLTMCTSYVRASQHMPQ